MAIAVVQTNSVDVSGSTTNLSFLSDVTANNLLVAVVSVMATTAPGAAGVSGGGTWTRIAAGNAATATDSSVSAYVCYNATGGPTTVAVNGGSAIVAAHIWELSGDGDAYDVTGTVLDQPATLNPAAYPAATTFANDAVVGFVSQTNGSWGSTIAAASGYTLRGSQNSAANMCYGGVDRVVAATGTYTPGLALGGASSTFAYSGATVTIKDSTALAPSPDYLCRGRSKSDGTRPAPFRPGLAR